MLDLNIQDRIKYIRDWVKEDKENRGCLVYVCEDTKIVDGAFCGFTLTGNVLDNLVLTLAGNSGFLDTMIMACFHAAMIRESDKDKTKKK